MWRMPRMPIERRVNQGDAVAMNGKYKIGFLCLFDDGLVIVNTAQYATFEDAE